jgi:tRNA(adenine34) deaminase
MRRALQLAGKAKTLGEVPVGAVIVQDDEIIGEGFNQPISTNDPSAHAEIVALRDAGARVGNYRLPEAVVYVTIEPCTMCVGALIHARVAKVVFGSSEPKAGALVSNLHLHEEAVYNHRLKVEQGPLSGDCAALIGNFFREKR